MYSIECIVSILITISNTSIMDMLELIRHHIIPEMRYKDLVLLSKINRPIYRLVHEHLHTKYKTNLLPLSHQAEILDQVQRNEETLTDMIQFACGVIDSGLLQRTKS